jgi:hypothetical protein
MSRVPRIEQNVLEPEARATLMVIGVLMVAIMIAVGLLATDRPGLRGSIDATAGEIRNPN